MNVTASAPTIREAHDLAYQRIALIDWPQGFYRTDIGWRALARGEEESKADERLD